MKSWILAIAIMLFLEGAMLGIVPKEWQKIMQKLAQLPTLVLRNIGFLFVCCAFILLLLVRFYGGV